MKRVPMVSPGILVINALVADALRKRVMRKKSLRPYLVKVVMLLLRVKVMPFNAPFFASKKKAVAH